MDMKTAHLPIADIDVAEYNPRIPLEPGDPAYEALKTSITEHGAAVPLVWNEATGRLVSGHQRLRVMADLGETSVDVVVVDLDDTREKALNLALNKIDGRWDDDKLLDLLDSIDGIASAGFSDEDYDDLLRRIDQAHATSFLDDFLTGDVDTSTDVNDLEGDDAPPDPTAGWTRVNYPVDAEGRSTIIAAITEAKSVHGTDAGGALTAICATYLAEETADA